MSEGLREIHVTPTNGGSIDNQLKAAYYFYTDYDPTTHFTYNVAFDDNNDIDNDQTLENQRQALIKVLEYHFSFEQVLPKENTPYIRFFRPWYSDVTIDHSVQKPTDFDDFASIDYKGITDNDLINMVEIPTKSELCGQIKIDRALDKDYSQMTIRWLTDLYDDLKNTEPYKNATRWNLHACDCALYCRIERPPEVIFDNGNQKIVQDVDPASKQPLWYSESDTNKIVYKDKNGETIIKNGKYPILRYVNAYEFRKNMKLINDLFRTKIPAEDGWYRYDKVDGKWKFLCDIEPTTKLNYDFEFASEVNQNG